MKKLPKTYLSRQTIMTAAIVLLCAALPFGAFFTYQHIFFKSQPTPEPTPECWMNIFVHGTFGTAMGLLSMMDVINDAVENTNYKKMISLMRNDPYFYQLQPLQRKGLFPITPTFDTHHATYKYAIYPITAAYQQLLSAIRGRPQEKNLFYTYGWSGLISQNRRRKEAVRFYNALCNEYEVLKKQGLSPKIRIIAHSHGGNVALNMGGIHELLVHGQSTITPPERKHYLDTDHYETCKKLYEIMLELPESLTKSQHTFPHKNLDYKPKKASFTIDELICLGTPIQPETVAFFHADFFATTYNIYSDDDVIQEMDWVSTRRRYSDKRVPVRPDDKKVMQVKITLKTPGKTEPKQEQGAESATIFDTLSSVATKIFGEKVPAQGYDPLHKEFWFMGWKEAQKQSPSAQRHIYPYPYVILLPYVQHLLKKGGNNPDTDIRIKFKNDATSITCYPHNKPEKSGKIYLQPGALESLKEQVSAWQPDDTSFEKEMGLLHAYSKLSGS